MEMLTVRGLYKEAMKAFTRLGVSQQDLAPELGIDRSAISRAVRSAGMKHAAVQARIISYEKGVPVQRRSTYEGSEVRHEWVIDP